MQTTIAMTEDQLLEALRGGDEQAFNHLVSRHHAAMLRVARNYVACASVAEEVVQETWLGVLKGIDSFRGGSSLKTWIFRILINRAMSRGKREKRIVPFASLQPAGESDSEGFSPDRFLFAGADRADRAAVHEHGGIGAIEVFRRRALQADLQAQQRQRHATAAAVLAA